MPSAQTTSDEDENDVSKDVSLNNGESEVTSFLENCTSASIIDYSSAKVSTNGSFLGNRSQDSQVEEVMENEDSETAHHLPTFYVKELQDIIFLFSLKSNVVRDARKFSRKDLGRKKKQTIID